MGWPLVLGVRPVAHIKVTTNWRAAGSKLVLSWRRPPTFALPIEWRWCRVLPGWRSVAPGDVTKTDGFSRLVSYDSARIAPFNLVQAFSFLSPNCNTQVCFTIYITVERLSPHKYEWNDPRTPSTWLKSSIQYCIHKIKFIFLQGVAHCLCSCKKDFKIKVFRNICHETLEKFVILVIYLTSKRLKNVQVFQMFNTNK